jgi:hypothetical protein
MGANGDYVMNILRAWNEYKSQIRKKQKLNLTQDQSNK